MPRRRKPSVCTRCGDHLPRSAITQLSKQGVSVVRQHLCTPCLELVAPALVRFQHDREKLDAEIRSLYGIGVEDYERLVLKQDGQCAICRAIPQGLKRLVVDHCHATGRVRGLLCNRCNLAIGQFEDDVGLLAQAIRYLSSDYAG